MCYQAHVENYGWRNEVCDGDVAGTTGEALRMEALRVKLVGAPPGTDICYRAHVENIGWMPDEACDGDMTGTTGERLRMEAVRIRIRR